MEAVVALVVELVFLFLPSGTKATRNASKNSMESGERSILTPRSLCLPQFHAVCGIQREADNKFKKQII